MRDTPVVKVGQWVRRGTLLGYVGSTGNSTGPHCHYDIANRKLLSFTSYVYGWSYQAVKSVFLDPTPYVKNNLPMKASPPLMGYHYLQGVRDPKNGLYFHPGSDLNGINDLGMPIYAPTEGRVVCALGTSWLKGKLGKLFPQNWNGGWGNMVVIEEKPGYDIAQVTP